MRRVEQPSDEMSFVELGVFPTQRSWAPPDVGLLASTTVLAPGAGRDARAQLVLENLAQEWGLPRRRAHRWLAAAGLLLEGPTPLEMYVQLDRATKTLTLELWAEGRVLFGIDDWLGV